MGSDPGPRQSALQRLLWLIIPLLLLAAAANYDNFGKRLRGETTTPKVPAASRMRQPRKITIEIPPDMGAPDAKVVFEVFLPHTSACQCHVEAAAYGRAVGDFDPRHWRVRFRDLALQDTKRRMKALGAPIPCGGFAINGKYQFRVAATPPGREKTRVVDFLAATRNWGIEEIYSVLLQQSQAAYGKGFAIDHARFMRNVTDEVQRLVQEGTALAATPEGASGR